MSGKSTEELKLEDNSEASFNQFLDRGCFDVCVDYAKHVQRQRSSDHITKTFQGRLPSLILEVHLQDKRECAPGEEEVVHKLLLLAGDIETNPGPVVRPCQP